VKQTAKGLNDDLDKNEARGADVVSEKVTSVETDDGVNKQSQSTANVKKTIDGKTSEATETSSNP